jgi:hypothetical protein
MSTFNDYRTPTWCHDCQRWETDDECSFDPYRQEPAPARRLFLGPWCEAAVKLLANSEPKKD